MRSTQSNFNCEQFTNKFFTRVESFARRVEIQFCVVVVKMHEGIPASPTVVISRLEENSTEGALYLLARRVSRLMRFCNTNFGGLELNIAEGCVVEAIFYTRIRKNEMDVLASFFNPAENDKTMHGTCSASDDDQARPGQNKQHSSRASRSRCTGGTRARKPACQ